MFGGILGASVMSIIADLIPMERRGTAMGVLTSGFSVASVFGVPFGLFIANLSDWHAPFLFLGLVGCVIFYFIWKFVPNVNEHILSKEARPEPWNIITNIVTDKEQVKALLLMMALMLGHFCIVPFISPYMVANVGFTDGDLTYIYLIGGAFTIFTSPLIGKWSDKYGKLKMFTLFVVLCWIPAIGITHMPKIPLVAALFVTSLFFIFSGGRFIPAQAMVSGAVKPATRGSFMSFSSAMQQMMAGVASYVAGLIVTKAPDGTLNGYNYVGYISVALTMLCIFLARRLKIKEGSEHTVRPEIAVVES
jgi:predicted MFS family arabinose efflux permease